MEAIRCLSCGTELSMNYNGACPVCGVSMTKAKRDFLKYLGPEDSLAGYYVRSYKLTFLKSIFEELLEHKRATCSAVTARFKKYYTNRIENGLIADKHADPRISHADESSLRDIYKVILENPYNAIHRNGFIEIEGADMDNGQFIFCDGLNNLTDEEIKTLISLMEKKLVLYYDRIGTKVLQGEADSLVLKTGDTLTEENTESDAEKNPPTDIDPSLLVLTPPICIPLDLPIEALELGTRAYNALKRNNIHLLGDLMRAVEDNSLLEFHNIGKKSIDEILEALKHIEEYGVSEPTLDLFHKGAFNPTKDSISTLFSNFQPFCKYCEKHNMRTLSDLRNFDFTVLLEIRGYGPERVDTIRSLYNALCNDDGTTKPEPDQGAAPAPSSAEVGIIHSSNDNLGVGVLGFFGASPHMIKLLSAHGCNKLSDVSHMTKGELVKFLGKDRSQTVETALGHFVAPLVEVSTEILDLCSDGKDFGMYLKRAEGRSLQNIATENGLTRERVRQICDKFQRKISSIMLSLAAEEAEINRGAYCTEDQILGIFDNDDYDTIIMNVLQNSEKYYYLDFARVFVNQEQFPNIEKELQRMAAEIVGDGINFFENIDHIEGTLGDLGYDFIPVDSFIDLVSKYNYKIYGDYIIRSKKSYGLLCAELVEDVFPDGIKLNDEDINQLRQIASEKYTGLELPKNNHAFITRICDHLVLRGKSTYISPAKISVDRDILNSIKDFIDQHPQKDIYYGEIFSEFEGLLMMTSNIDNAAFLHGVLSYYYPESYSYSRDFLTKKTSGESMTLAERICSILEDAGTALDRKSILQQLPGITDVMLFNAVNESNTLIQWEPNFYNSIKNIHFSAQEMEFLGEQIDELLEKNQGYTSEELLYGQVEGLLQGALDRNGVCKAQNLFYIAASYFGDRYDFRKPHIAKRGRFQSLNVKDIALDLLGFPVRFNSIDYLTLANQLRWPSVTAGLVIADIEKEYSRISKNEYIQNDSIPFTLEDQKFIAEKLDTLANGSWYVPLQRFVNIDDCLPCQLYCNEFIVESIINHSSCGWHIIQPHVQDRRIQKGFAIRNDKTILKYDHLISAVLKEFGIDSINETQLLEFLQIHSLVIKVIPKEIYESELFTVVDGTFLIK